MRSLSIRIRDPTYLTGHHKILHTYTPPSAIRLHIGVATAETGVSRFGECLSSAIEYDKTEQLPLGIRVRVYDYLTVEPAEA